jgi:hypothetical protein
MLKHIVMFKYRDGVAKDDPRVAEAYGMLARLPAQIPEVRAWEHGHNVSGREIAYDLALYSAFDDEAALQRYSDHPAHRAVVGRLREICTWHVVDYVAG